MGSIFTDSFSDDSISMVADDDLQYSPSTNDSGEQTIVVEESLEPETLDIEKRGPGRPRKQKEGMTEALHVSCRSVSHWCISLAPPLQNMLISYTLVMYSFAQMKKPKMKRSEETAIIKLSQDEPFDTLKAQILNEIPSCISCCNDTHSFVHIKYDATRCKKIVLMAADESLDL